MTYKAYRHIISYGQIPRAGKRAKFERTDDESSLNSVTLLPRPPGLTELTNQSSDRTVSHLKHNNISQSSEEGNSQLHDDNISQSSKEGVLHPQHNNILESSKEGVLDPQRDNIFLSQSSEKAVLHPQHNDISQPSKLVVSHPQSHLCGLNDAVNAFITAYNHMFPMYFADAIQRKSKPGGTLVAAISITCCFNISTDFKASL